MPYYEKFGNEIEGVFTDEPQLSRNGIPWSFVLPDEYKKEYGENIEDIIYDVFFDSKTSSRSHLTAFVSKDDGATWEGGLILDERSGVSYPEIAVGSDGTIYVQYDRGRASVAEILFARFTESDVR